MPRTASAPAIEVLEAHAGRGAERRLLAQPHPGFGDDAEDALGADEHAVGAGPGAGAGQAARLQRADRRHHPRALDEIVDVGVERGVVAARAGGDPAAQRRAAIGLHVVAHGERRLAQLRPRSRARRCRPGCAQLGSRRSTSSILSMWRIEIVTTLSNAGLRLDALHHRRAAAIGNRLGADLVAPVEHAHDVLLVLRERPPRRADWAPSA